MHLSLREEGRDEEGGREEEGERLEGGEIGSGPD